MAMGCLAAACGAAAAAATAGHASRTPRRASSAQGLDVLPFPGTPDAAPATNIDLPAASPAQVQSITAVGSSSGLHAGHLSAQPAGHGTAFSPNRSFSPGERVSVTATFRSATAGTASGAPGAKQINFSFSIAQAGSIAGSEGRGANPPRPHSTTTSQPRTHSFVTHPGFQAPVVTMSGKNPDTASGDIFLDAEASGQDAAYFLNPQGALLWYQPSKAAQRGPSIFNTRVQRYEHHRVITYWQGLVVPSGIGHGQGYILNSSYKTIHTVQAGKGYQKRGIDLHEFTLGHEGSEGTAFVQIWSPARTNLTSVGGPANGTALDWIIREIDVATNKVIWEWHALGHVPVRYSYIRYVPGQTSDFFHPNSIQQLPDGNVLICMRHTWAAYLINKKTGKIIWTLGGKHSSFKMGPGTKFAWPHDATLQKGGLLTLFDDGSGVTKEESQSRALKLHLNTTKHKVTLVHQYLHSPPTLASSQGSAQILPNGNVFAGWGNTPYFSEYTPGGTQLFSGSFVAPVKSYRAYRFNWVGSPPQPPAIAVRPATTAGVDAIYASWNGATRVAKWQVLSSSSSAGPFAKVGSPVPWSDFETKMHAPKASYFKVEAMNARGVVLGTSGPAGGR